VPNDLLTPAEARALLSCSENTLRSWLRAGEIPHHRLGPAGRLIRIPRGRLLQWVEARSSVRAAS
jgi:excisionase family DNA binding protein